MKRWQSIIISALLLIIFGLGYYVYFLTNRADNIQKNSYDYSFSELVNNINNIENYLAKTLISKSARHSTDTLTKIWADSNLAIVYIENIPFDAKGSQQSIKFLNQVSDYSYTLSRKTIKGEELNDEDFENLKKLYKYAKELKDTVNQISYELDIGQISWDDLKTKSKLAFEDDDKVPVFASIEENFDDYEGLIYDGAYSDYIVKEEKLGLTGEAISQIEAENKIEEILMRKEISSTVLLLLFQILEESVLFSICFQKKRFPMRYLLCLLVKRYRIVQQRSGNGFSRFLNSYLSFRDYIMPVGHIWGFRPGTCALMAKARCLV